MTDTAHPCPLCGNDLDDRPEVCAGCTEWGRRNLADLPRLADVLTELAREQGGQSAAEPVSGSRERPLPLKTAIWSFIGLAPPGDVHTDHPEDQLGDVPLADALFSWCRLEAEEFTLTTPRVRRNAPQTAVGEFVDYLGRQHQRACSQPWADEYLTEVHALWARARTLAQDWPLVHKLPAPCPYCGLTTLRRDNGADFVYCDHRQGGCSRRWVQQDYIRLVHMLVAEAEEAGWTQAVTRSRKVHAS